jgi:hypothetical protein
MTHLFACMDNKADRCPEKCAQDKKNSHCFYSRGPNIDHSVKGIHAFCASISLFRLRHTERLAPFEKGKVKGRLSEGPVPAFPPGKHRDRTVLLGYKSTPIAAGRELSLATGMDHWSPGIMESIRNQTFCWRWGVPLC